MMRLGGGERERLRSDDGIGRPAPRTRNCHKVRHLASRLGETFAGHRMRTTVVEQTCALELVEGHVDEVWAWPWRSASLDELPPNPAGRFGAWEVRCGPLGRRQRCALLHVAGPAVDVAGAEPRISTHFIMDAVAGRESVVWRVIVGARGATPAAAPKRDLGDEPGARPATSAGDIGITFALGSGLVRVAYAMCRSGTCVMEAGPRHASEIASRLADGRPVEIRLAGDQDEGQAIVVPPAGFRAGFNALAKLRREELRGPR
ncbi:MAG TPA: hypothetical protein PK264_00965 [Hyphomicrobiaceae bacterium]|nr:hypothetical protein [Hyphomicrobiaceae bacterium]